MTEQHPITAALLAAMAQSDEAMVLSDPHLADHPIIAVNAAFVAMTGYAESECVGRNCRFLQGAGTDAATARRLGRTIAEGEGCVEWIVNHRKNGSAFWNLLFLSPVRSEDGRLLHFFGNQHDITEGLPARIKEVGFGPAHMGEQATAEFQRLLHDVTASRETAADAARALETTLRAARRLAEISTSLAPGRAGESH